MSPQDTYEAGPNGIEVLLKIYCAVSLLTGFHDAFSGRDQHGGEGGMLGKVQSLVLG